MSLYDVIPRQRPEHAAVLGDKPDRDVGGDELDLAAECPDRGVEWDQHVAEGMSQVVCLAPEREDHRRTVQLGASWMLDRLSDRTVTSRTAMIFRNCERMLQAAASAMASCDGGGMK